MYTLWPVICCQNQLDWTLLVVETYRLNSHPPTSMSPHLIQKLKNQMRQGMTEPVLPGPGAATDVVTGISTPAALVELELELELDFEGVNVVVCPFGLVMTTGVVIPVGIVTAPALSDTIV